MTIKKINTLIKLISFSLVFTLISVSSAFADFSRSCDPFNVFRDDGTGDNFIMLSFYNTIAEVCSQVATTSWDLFAPALQGVMAIGIGIYIAMYTLKNLGSFSQQDTAAYLTSNKGGVIPIACKGAFIIFLLGNSEFVYKYLISTIIMAGAEIGGNGSEWNFENVDNVRGLFDVVIDVAKNINDQVYEIVAMGRLMLCLAFLPEGIFDWYWVLVPFGFTFYVFGWIIIIYISFYMLDILFRLGVGCMLLPMAIACSISKLSISYTKKSWGLFVNVAFNFVMLSVVIQLTIEVMTEAVSAGAENSNLTDLLFTNVAGHVLNQSEVDLVAESMSLIGFILLAICCIVAMKLFMDVEDITDKLSNAGMKGKGSAMQKMATQYTGKAAHAVGHTAKEVGGTIAKETGKDIAHKTKLDKAGHNISQGYRKLKRNVKDFFKLD